MGNGGWWQYVMKDTCILKHIVADEIYLMDGNGSLWMIMEQTWPAVGGGRWFQVVVFQAWKVVGSGGWLWMVVEGTKPNMAADWC